MGCQKIGSAFEGKRKLFNVIWTRGFGKRTYRHGEAFQVVGFAFGRVEWKVSPGSLVRLTVVPEIIQHREAMAFNPFLTTL